MPPRRAEEPIDRHVKQTLIQAERQITAKSQRQRNNRDQRPKPDLRALRPFGKERGKGEHPRRHSDITQSFSNIPLPPIWHAVRVECRSTEVVREEQTEKLARRKRELAEIIVINRGPFAISQKLALRQKLNH